MRFGSRQNAAVVFDLRVRLHLSAVVVSMGSMTRDSESKWLDKSAVG